MIGPMTWYADLDHYSRHFPDATREESKLVAVGWLAAGQPYATGELRDDVVAKLLTLLADPWQPVQSTSVHACPFCRITGGPKSFGYNGLTIHMGQANLFVPGVGQLYVVPSLIAHYIDAHGYWPPEEFCTAVLACPPTRTPEYLRAILANGGRGLVPPRKP
jgi:hypothetical protein